ncbi:MAG: hypothetical protein JRG79_13465, partial [Deltaproteobacteria bacterium]|nr:hypothetical protein [Deltaproteobacteria bacterium]
NPAISTPEIAGDVSVTISGTLNLGWEHYVTLDTSLAPNNNIHNDDVFEIAVEGISGDGVVSYTVAGNWATGLATAINSADDVNNALKGVVAEDSSGSSSTITVRIVAEDDSLLDIGPLEEMRVKDNSDAVQLEADTTHYERIKFTFSADYWTGWSPGETWKVVVDGVVSSYTVSNKKPDGVTNWDPSERNLGTIAAQLAADINSKHADLYASVEVTGTTEKVVSIVIRDKDDVAEQAGDGVDDPFKFSVERGGSVLGVFDIDESSPLTRSYLTKVGERVEQIKFLGIVVGTYKVPVYATLSFTTSPALELIRVSDGAVVASDWYDIPETAAGYDAANNNPRVVDIGSKTAYDPFIEFTFNTEDVGDYHLRVSSVVNYNIPTYNRDTDTISYTPYQYKYSGVYPGQGYELIASLPRHDRNQQAIELEGKVLTIVEGTGKGQSAVIIGYEPESKEYTLNPITAWVVSPDATSRYEITTKLSQESLDPAYKTMLDENPITDDYTVVLSALPDSSVIIDVLPKETRTYNSDEAFNADAGFGANNEEQVRVATDHTIIKFSGTVTEGEYWIITLGGTDMTVNVDTLLQAVKIDLLDDILGVISVTDGAVTTVQNYGSTNNDVFVYQVAAGDTLQDVVNGLQAAIVALADYSVYDSTELALAQPGANALTIVSSVNFYTGYAITPDTAGSYTSEVTRDDIGIFQEVAVELTGLVAMGETWTLNLKDILDADFIQVATYTAEFGDNLADVARNLAEQVLLNHGDDYDVILRGRVLTISNATEFLSKDILAEVVISPDSQGDIAVIPQLVFTTADWNVPQTVNVMAIDDEFVDGGDALVFPAFEERVNAIRGPLTIEGGTLVGEERFLNDPFRLPGETNKPQADGTLADAYTNLEGKAVLVDPEAFHFNALTGERPGFDPRMNDYPFEFTFLSGPALDTYLDVESVSKEILSVGDDEPFTIILKIDGNDPAANKVEFSGTPDQNILDTLSWSQAVVTLTGSANLTEVWRLILNDSDIYEVTVTEGNRALSKIAAALGDAVNADAAGYVAEVFVDILGNSKLRIYKTDGSLFKVEFENVGGQGGAIVSGTPDQLLLNNPSIEWTQAAFRIIGSVSAGESWLLTLTQDGTPYTATVSGATTIDELTTQLADQINTDFMPLVSGSTVTFATPWLGENTSTVILSGE